MSSATVCALAIGTLLRASRASHRSGRVDAVAHVVTMLRRAGAVRAAVEVPVDLDAVTDDRARAVLADRRQLLDRALEAVEHVPVPGRRHFERLVVVVPAHFADAHVGTPLLSCPALSRPAR